MTKHKHQGSVLRGFTVIEVTLALAISMFLFIGVIGGTTVNVTRQRYNDSVQNFAEFLRREYSEVISVQNTRDDEVTGGAPCTVTSGETIGNSSAEDVQTGRSNCLIYGKLINFGEYSPSDDTRDIIHTYDIIGDALSFRDLTSLNADTSSPYYDIKDELVRSLANVSAGVLTVRRENTDCRVTLAGNESSYRLEWDAYPQDAEGNIYQGAVIIVRSPLSGAVSTFTLDEPLPVQETLDEYENYSALSPSECYNYGYRYDQFYEDSLEEHLARTSPPYEESELPKFKEVDFCIASDDIFALGNGRRMVSIDKDGYNASAIRVSTQDSEDNKCS